MAEETMQVDENQIDLSGDGGVLKKILKEGTSDEMPSTGCKVSVNYVGSFPDGKKFDWSNAPFEFPLNKGKMKCNYSKFIGIYEQIYSLQRPWLEDSTLVLHR